MVRHAVQTGAAPIFLFVVGSVLFDGLESWMLFVAVALGVSVGAAYGLAWFLRFEYDLTDDTLDITSGVIARRKREIPYQRIQTVDMTRTVIYRLFGLAVVRIETAGGGSTEAALDFVSAPEAERIKRLVRTRRTQAVEGTADATTEGAVSHVDRMRTDQPEQRAPDQPGKTAAEKAPPDEAEREPPEASTHSGDDEEMPTVFFRLSIGELLLYSLLTFRTGAVAVVLFSLPLVRDYLPQRVYSIIEALGGATSLATMTPAEAPTTALIVGSAVLMGAYLVSAVYGAVTYYGFTLGRRGDDLVYECGLFQRYSGSIPLSKVQSLTLTENVPMRQLGYAGLTVDTAAYDGNASGGRLSIGSGAPSTIPAAQRDVALDVARAIEGVGSFTIQHAPVTARRRYAVRYGLVVTAVVAASALVASVRPEIEAWYLPAVFFAGVPLAAHLKWLHRGYDADETHVVLRTGFWVRRSTIVPYERLQTMTRTQSVFQRRLDLANFIADTASSISITGATPTAFDIDVESASALHERCRDRLQARIRER
jgi:putative membrane protein